MILLKKEDEKDLVDFLYEDPTANLFLIGDYDLYGLEDEACQYYGLYEIGQLQAVIMCYKEMSLHIVTHKKDMRIINEIKRLLDVYPKITSINLFEKSYELLKDLDENLVSKARATILSEYQPEDVNIKDYPVEILTEQDAQQIYKLQRTAFNLEHSSPEKVAQAIRSKASVVYGVKVCGKLISTATYTAQTKDRAMIIAVCTDKEYQGQGYASAVVRKLSDDLWQQGRAGVLFYDNPSAAHVYERLGYKRYGQYIMIGFK